MDTANKDKKNDELVLKKRRESSDRVTASVRASTDINRTRPNDQNDPAQIFHSEQGTSKLLSRERDSMDATMNSERSHFDDYIQRATNLLQKEVSEHSKTKAALLTRDEYLAIVSHDLRNPIGTILSCSDMILEDGLIGGNKEVERWLQLIKRNADSALRLINDLLDMERVAEGRLEVQTKSTDLVDIAKKSVENFVDIAAAKSILIRAKVAHSEIYVHCDRDRISQALSNLIGNALKFTESGGTIIVGADQTPTSACLSVKDDGPGIPLEKQHQIFSRFSQLKNSDRRGLGLGLYISKMVVEAHGGTIGVRSSMGTGSTFYLTLPKMV